MTIRTAKHACDLDESKLSTASEDCQCNFPNIKEIRKEQKTSLLNLARGKDFFVILPTSFGKRLLFFLAVSTSGKSCSEFRIYDNSSFAVGFRDVRPSGAVIGIGEDVEEDQKKEGIAKHN